MSEKRSYTPEEKVKVLREILEDGKKISQVADIYGLHPNNIFKWKKQLFEGGLQIFQIKRSDISAKAEGRKITALENKIKQKDEVIAELAEELLALKKKSCGQMQGRQK